MEAIDRKKVSGYCPHCGMKYTADQLEAQLKKAETPDAIPHCPRCKQLLSTGTEV